MAYSEALQDLVNAKTFHGSNAVLPVSWVVKETWEDVGGTNVWVERNRRLGFAVEIQDVLLTWIEPFMSSSNHLDLTLWQWLRMPTVPLFLNHSGRVSGRRL